MTKDTTPSVAVPAVREPSELLTDAEIDECLLGGLDAGSGEYTKRFARRIEAKVRAALSPAPAERRETT